MATSILFVSQRLPWPLTSGGDIRTFHIARELGQEFEVDFIGGAESEEQGRVGAAALSEFCREVNIVPSLPTWRPLSLFRTGVLSAARNHPAFVVYNQRPELASAVTSYLQVSMPDVIHLNHLDTTPYVRPFPAVPYVIDTHNLLYSFYRRRSKLGSSSIVRWLWAVESERLRRYERKVFKRAISVLTCSEAERRALRHLDRQIEVAVVPNGVDCRFFSRQSGEEIEGGPRIIFVGDMAYGPNHDAVMGFCGKVLSSVLAEHPTVEFLVVGRHPRKALLHLASIHPNVTVTGTVEDVRPYLNQAVVFVVPIRFASGTRLKILEAFAMGVPVVSTTVGAEGIDYEAGRDLLIADNPSAMTEAICRLVADEELRASISARARRKALESYDWGAIGGRLVEHYHQLGVSG